MDLPDHNKQDEKTDEDNDLEEKIVELQAQLQTLQVQSNIRAGFMHYTGKERWFAIAYLIPLVILSFLPPLFVLFDRWLFLDQFTHYSRDNWCKVDFLCQSHLPAYFTGIFLFLGLVSILMVVFAPSFHGKFVPIFTAPNHDRTLDLVRNFRANLRKQLFLITAIGLVFEIIFSILFMRVPGMELLLVVITGLVAIFASENELDPLKIGQWLNRFKEKAPLYGTMVYSQIALILFLKDATSFKSPHWIYIFLLFSALAAVFWQRKKIHKIFWIFSLALILFTFQMNSWKYSMIGDEYSFFFYPNENIAHQSFPQMADWFFNIRGVYDIVPYFSSFVTYLFMAFLGFDHFSWHLSIILLMVLMIPMFYDFFKTFVPERIAFFAVIPLAFSHYLVNFSKIGYTNLQALFMMCLILWVASRAVRQPSFSIYFLLGISCGVCFYTYPLGIYTIPLAGLLILLFDPPRSRITWLRYSFALAGLLVMMVPVFFQPVFWSNMAGRTVFYINNGDIISSSSSTDLFNRFAYNLLYIPFVYLFIPGEGNYVVSSLVDPLLAVFVPLGFLLSLTNIRRNGFSLFLTLSYIIELLIISISNPYDSPPLTRMFLFLPFYFVFAMIGLDWLLKLIAGITNQPGKFFYTAITGILVAAGFINMVQSTLIYDLRTERYPLEPVVLRLMQHDALEKPDETKTYLFITDKDSSLFWYDTFQGAYDLPDSKAQLQRLIVDSPDQLNSEWINRMKEQEDTVIILSYQLAEPLFNSLQPLLEQTGRKACDVRDLPGKFLRYRLWYPEKYPNLCLEAQSQY